jgi:hypothetical protein
LKVCLLTAKGNEGILNQVRRALGDGVSRHETLSAAYLAVHQRPVDLVVFDQGPDAPPLLVTVRVLRSLGEQFVIVLCDDDLQGAEALQEGANAYITRSQLASNPWSLRHQAEAAKNHRQE